MPPKPTPFSPPEAKGLSVKDSMAEYLLMQQGRVTRVPTVPVAAQPVYILTRQVVHALRLLVECAVELVDPITQVDKQMAWLAKNGPKDPQGHPDVKTFVILDNVTTDKVEIDSKLYRQLLAALTHTVVIMDIGPDDIALMQAEQEIDEGAGKQ